MTDKQLDFPGEAKPGSGTGNYTETFSPVTVKETVGATFLGILSLILTIALLCALARNRKLEVQLARLAARGLSE